MAMEALINVLRTIQERIEKHKALLSQSEALTRYVLIDPLLRALSWDLENPDRLRPEYVVAGKLAADYGLLEEGKPIIFVEAKKLGTLLEGGLSQSINYCIQEGTRYFAVTDGQRWEVYDTQKSGPIKERMVASFSLQDPNLTRTAASALFLWRGNYTHVAIPTLVGPVSLPEAVSVPKLSLANLHATMGDKPPKSIIAPDGAEMPSPYWNSILINVADWLVKKGKLTAALCPVHRPGTVRHIINTNATHSNGRAFDNKRQIGDLWLELSFYGPSELVRDAVFLLSYLGEDPKGWQVNK